MGWFRWGCEAPRCCSKLTCTPFVITHKTQNLREFATSPPFAEWHCLASARSRLNFSPESTAPKMNECDAVLGLQSMRRTRSGKIPVRRCVSHGRCESTTSCKHAARRVNATWCEYVRVLWHLLFEPVENLLYVVATACPHALPLR